MVKHIPIAWIFLNEFDHYPYKTQLCPIASARYYPSQLLSQSLSIAYQVTSYSKQQKHRHCYKHKHSRPGFYAGDFGLRKPQHPFAISKSLFAAKAPAILTACLLGAHPAVAHHLPYPPLALPISLPALRHVEPSRTPFAVTQPAKTAPSLVALQPKYFELAPLPVEVTLILPLVRMTKLTPSSESKSIKSTGAKPRSAVIITRSLGAEASTSQMSVRAKSCS